MITLLIVNIKGDFGAKAKRKPTDELAAGCVAGGQRDSTKVSAGLRADGPGATDNTYDALDIKRLALAQMSPKITDRRAGWGAVCLFSLCRRIEESAIEIENRENEN